MSAGGRCDATRRRPSKIACRCYRYARNAGYRGYKGYGIMLLSYFVPSIPPIFLMSDSFYRRFFMNPHKNRSIRGYCMKKEEGTKGTKGISSVHYRFLLLLAAIRCFPPICLNRVFLYGWWQSLPARLQFTPCGRHVQISRAYDRWQTERRILNKTTEGVKALRYRRFL